MLTLDEYLLLKQICKDSIRGKERAEAEFDEDENMLAEIISKRDEPQEMY